MKARYLLALAAVGALAVTSIALVPDESEAQAVTKRNRGYHVFDRLASTTTVLADNYQTPVGSSTYAASGDIDLSTLRSAGIFYITPKGGIDLDLANESDLDTQDFGVTWTFVITSAGDSAQGPTFTDGATGVVVKTRNTLGTTCEDLGDQIDCTGIAAELITCKTFCAD